MTMVISCIAAVLVGVSLRVLLGYIVNNLD